MQYIENFDRIGFFIQVAYSTGNWLRDGIKGQPKALRPFRQKNQDEIIKKILGMPSGSKHI